MGIHDRIVADPAIRFGKPTVRGTRLTVYAVAARIQAGETVSALLDGYPPEITEAHVRAAVAVLRRTGALAGARHRAPRDA